MSTKILDTEKYWFALRDLKRSNAIYPAYKQLSELEIEVFTPMKWRITKRNGKQFGREVPVMPDLLFAYDTRKRLDPIVSQPPTLQYRYKKGGAYCEPIVVPDNQMNQFISGCYTYNDKLVYLSTCDVTFEKGMFVRIIGGIFNGVKGVITMVSNQCSSNQECISRNGFGSDRWCLYL